MGKIIDILGQKFGKLTVLSFEGLKNRRNAKWMCKCDCGNYKSVSGSDLRSGNTISCGCFAIQRIKEVNTKHGNGRRSEHSPEYIAWSGMKERCLNPNASAYEYYGQRGIKICDRWINSFENFLADMGVKPSTRHSLDRFPNNENGNYEPENCRWATKKQQANNVRDNIVVEYKGEFKTLSEWRDELGFNYGTVSSRLRNGYSVEVAFETAPGKLYFERIVNMPSEESIKKLVERSRVAILQYTKEGVFVKEHYSMSQAARDLGILSTSIKNCVAGLSKSAGGFIWKKK
jgi:hypothetical protein